MADDLPDEFDLIVVGTGFPESCVAAAASRVGKLVLHVDPNEYYGGAWASFGVALLIDVLENNSNAELRNCSYKWHAKPAAGEVAPADPCQIEGSSCSKEEWTKERVLEESRRFNLDLTPKILYSSGDLVQLLISSNICRYAEFRAVDCVCTRLNDDILNVPCSRSDVFNTKDLNIVEKRLLMKFLSTCLTFGDGGQQQEEMCRYRGKTFREYLLEQKVTAKITTCVMQAIAMCTDETPFETGMENTKKFLQSLGRYGNTPFLFPMYGCGEIPQCFCRLCAVFGGIYCLKRRFNSVQINADTNCVNVLLDERQLRAKNIVFSHGNVPASLQEMNVGIHGFGELVNRLSRGIYLATSPLGCEELNRGGGGVNLLRLVAGEREAILIQLAHSSGTCPRGVYVFHITTPALSDSPEEDLQPFAAQVFSEVKFAATLIFSAHFSLTARMRTAECSHVDGAMPLYCTDAPLYEMDYEQSIRNARDIFEKLYPDSEFLPRAPDPEEIVIEGEDPRALDEINLAEDLRQQLRLLDEAAVPMDTATDSA